MLNKNLARKILAIAALITIFVGGANAFADNDKHKHGLWLSDRPKTIVLDNLDKMVFTKGDPETAALAQEVCGDCHSTDYPMTQPKLTCAGWGKEMVKMGNTFGAIIPWNEDQLEKQKLYEILAYLTDNYGAGGSSACTGHELDALSLNQ